MVAMTTDLTTSIDDHAWIRHNDDYPTTSESTHPEHPSEKLRDNLLTEIHELFVLALSLVWFAGATPEVSQTIAATPPLLSVKMACRSPKKGLTRGHRRKNLPLRPIALEGASHEIVSPIALYPENPYPPNLGGEDFTPQI